MAGANQYHCSSSKRVNVLQFVDRSLSKSVEIPSFMCVGAMGIELFVLNEKERKNMDKM